MAEPASNVVWESHPERLVTISKRRDPSVYYRNCPDLYVTGRFRTHVALKSESAEVGRAFRVNEDETGTGLSNTQFKNAFSGNRSFDGGAVCAIVAEMRELGQFEKGCTYLLCIAQGVVLVFWEPDGRRLMVDSLSHSEPVQWPMGVRVLTPAN